jgi:hypothetical protein
MHEFWQNLSDQWAVFSQQLTLEWEAIQAQPGGILGAMFSWFLSFGQWLRAGNRGLLVVLLLVIVLTRRFLKSRE